MGSFNSKGTSNVIPTHGGVPSLPQYREMLRQSSNKSVIQVGEMTQYRSDLHRLTIIEDLDHRAGECQRRERTRQEDDCTLRSSQ